MVGGGWGFFILILIFLMRSLGMHGVFFACELWSPGIVMYEVT